MEREAVIPNFPIIASTVFMTGKSDREIKESEVKLLTDWTDLNVWFFKKKGTIHTTGNEDGEQAGCATYSQKSQLGDLAGAIKSEQCDGACRHLHQTKDHLGQIDVHPKVRNVESQAVVHEHVGKPDTDGKK